MKLRHWTIEDETIKCILTQTATKWNYASNNTWKMVGSLRPKCWVKYTRNNGETMEGIIINTTNTDVQVRIKTGRRINQKYNTIEWWPKRKCKELRRKENTCTLEEIKEAPQDSNSETYDSDETNTEKIVPGLYNIMCKNNRIRFEMKQKGENSKNTAYIASDGSVLDRKYMGTFAWILLEHDSKNNLQQMGIEGCGKEAAYGLDTTEILSYRMEALALLSGLSYLRIDLKWKGKIHWFTDSKAVIDTYKKYAKHNSKPNHTNWIAQRDKDVWEMLLIEQEKWRGRLTLQHVESHVDRKKDEHGNYRIPNATQKMNIAADELAERTYNEDIPWLNKNELTNRTAQINRTAQKIL